MVKNHLKSISAPKTWDVQRKKNIFTTRPNPGSHSFERGMALRTICINVLGIIKTAKEMSYILHQCEVLVDGKRRMDPRHIVGLFDVISLPKIKKHFRVLFTKRGKITALECSDKESPLKPVKISGKQTIKAKTHVHCTDGRCIVADSSKYRIGDTLLLELPKQKILEHFPLEKAAHVYLTGGKHRGYTGTIQSIKDNEVTIQLSAKEIIRTAKRYVFVIGKEKASITLQ